MQELSGNTKKRILVVDDDTEQLEMLRSFLEPTYIVGTVSHGEFAPQYIREYQTDLVLCDVVMPEMDGFATLRAIRSTDGGSNIPVIFITGKSSRNIVLQSINVGIDGYLVKPVAKDSLLEKIKSVLTMQSYAAGRKTVLVADEDITYLKIINNSLKERYNVIMVNSTKLAKEYLGRHIPDVMVVDEKLSPDGEGSFFRYIKDREETANIPLVILKGISDRSENNEQLKVTADKYLIKPVSKLDLIKVIVSVVNSR